MDSKLEFDSESCNVQYIESDNVLKKEYVTAVFIEKYSTSAIS